MFQFLEFSFVSYQANINRKLHRVLIVTRYHANLKEITWETTTKKFSKTVFMHTYTGFENMVALVYVCQDV